LRLEVERLESVLGDSIAPRAAAEALRSLKLELYPYQQEGVDRFLAARRLLLADDMGLGKTAQATAICHVLWKTARARRGLLIVPASLKPQWLREWQLFTSAPATIVEGTPADRRAVFRSTKEGFLIVNYEQLLRDLEMIHAWKPDIVVLDEAQRIKNWATKTATYVKKLEPRYRLVLTGTPMENRLDELASLLDWVDDFALEPKWRLLPFHATFAAGGREISGARNLETLRARIAHCMVRRVRKEVLSQLPARKDTRVPIEMTEAQREEHDSYRDKIARILQAGRKRPLTQAEFLRLMSYLTAQRIISNGIAQHQFEDVWPAISRLAKPTEAILRSLSSPKLLELRELIHHVAVEQERKVVVFSQWVRMLRLAEWAVRDLLEQCGARAVFFTGEEKEKQREHNVIDLHDDPATRVLFASDAGGIGLNLQRAATCVINLELPWNPAVLEQRIGRIYRIGQRYPIDVYNLVSEVGIESRICELVGSKQALFKGLFDGTSDSVRFDSSGSFLTRVEKVVEAVRVPELSGEAGGNGELEAVVTPDEDLDPVIPGRAEAPESAPREIEVAPRSDSSSAPVASPSPDPAPAVASPAAPSAADVRGFFSRLEIRSKPGGGISIDAPPEAASTLAALFEGMARMLQGVGKN
ncbi:MAG TPA: DEAD/DEAH box helicase, partial [Planctomycetota bacterium]|nr:DEAD/DEAH box helicase [Planctomycetota bacterium]